MTRLNEERQKELEPKRIAYAKAQLEKLEFDVTESATELRFIYNGNVIKFFPYSGWHSGKGITDGRGIDKLLKQINRSKNEQRNSNS